LFEKTGYQYEHNRQNYQLSNSVQPVISQTSRYFMVLLYFLLKKTATESIYFFKIHLPRPMGVSAKCTAPNTSISFCVPYLYRAPRTSVPVCCAPSASKRVSPIISVRPGVVFIAAMARRITFALVSFSSSEAPEIISRYGVI